MRLWKRAVLYSASVCLAMLSVLFLAVPATSATERALRTLSVVNSPTVVGNFLVDQDRGLAFSKNKQNEPATTRDPLTGVLIAGANDEIQEPLCPGTTVPLASPCPFAPGVPISAYYRSTGSGKTWSGGFLPGFNTIARGSAGDPSPHYGPRRCPIRRARLPPGAFASYH